MKSGKQSKFSVLLTCASDLPTTVERIETKVGRGSTYMYIGGGVEERYKLNRGEHQANGPWEVHTGVESCCQSCVNGSIELRIRSSRTNTRSDPSFLS